MRPRWWRIRSLYACRSSVRFDLRTPLLSDVAGGLPFVRSVPGAICARRLCFCVCGSAALDDLEVVFFSTPWRLSVWCFSRRGGV